MDIEEDPESPVRGLSDVGGQEKRKRLRRQVERSFTIDLHHLNPIFIMSSSSTAQKTFELMNDVRALDPADEIFLYDVEEQKKLVRQAPWKQECVALPSLINESDGDSMT